MSITRVAAAGRDAQRRLLLDIASGLLETEGAAALTMRRIAAEAECSTTVLYSMFGGKSGVLEALWVEGFERLDRALQRVSAEDPLDRLAMLGRAYRETALANRAYYALMFQRPLPDFEPSPAAYAQSLRALRAITEAVQHCMNLGVFRPGDAAHIARVLWAATHGAVSLELAGYEGAVEADACFDDLLAGAAAWFLATPAGQR